MGGGDGDETLEQLEARHEAEEAELEEKASALLEAAKAGGAKGKKAKEKLEAAEREVEQLRYDLGERHKEEREELEERGGAPGGGAAAEAEGAAAAPAAAVSFAPSASPATEDDGEDEAERAARKKEKAQKKKQNRASKEREREEALEREKLEAGPARRDVELAQIAEQLAKQRPALKVNEVLGDGHCLYRSVADQLRRFRPDAHSWEKAPELAHEEIRAVCARALRERREGYEPFAELADGEDFARYCDRVERSGDWGGELELRALADELGVQILVYRADSAEPLALGDAAGGAKAKGKGEPLRVTYHKHWYALGEHYNSAILKD